MRGKVEGQAGAVLVNLRYYMPPLKFRTRRIEHNFADINTFSQGSGDRTGVVSELSNIEIRCDYPPLAGIFPVTGIS